MRAAAWPHPAPGGLTLWDPRVSGLCPGSGRSPFSPLTSQPLHPTLAPEQAQAPASPMRCCPGGWATWLAPAVSGPTSRALGESVLCGVSSSHVLNPRPMFLSPFLSLTSCIPVPGPLARPPDEALLSCQALPTEPHRCGPTLPHLHPPAASPGPWTSVSGSPLWDSCRRLSAAPLKPGRLGGRGGGGKGQSHPQASGLELPFRVGRFEEDSLSQPRPQGRCWSGSGALPSWDPHLLSTQNPAMDIRSFGPGGPVWPGNYGEHSWVPLLFLETGTLLGQGAGPTPTPRGTHEAGGREAFVLLFGTPMASWVAASWSFCL